MVEYTWTHFVEFFSPIHGFYCPWKQYYSPRAHSYDIVANKRWGFRRPAKTNKKGIVLQLIEGSDSLEPSIYCHPQIQALLDKFQVVFESPTGLPPIRIQDGHIELKGFKPICVRPYRYPYFQKTEIEKLI